jgi:methionine aminopeptidase
LESGFSKVANGYIPALRQTSARRWARREANTTGATDQLNIKIILGSNAIRSKLFGYMVARTEPKLLPCQIECFQQMMQFVTIIAGS